MKLGLKLSMILMTALIFAGCDNSSEIINGHKLPPVPDQTKNDATLLGIDSNNNGVRDDLEIWIYKTYNSHIPCREKNITISSSSNTPIYNSPIMECSGDPVPYSQIIIEMAMQHARAYQSILRDPENIAENTKLADAAFYCNVYFQNEAQFEGDPILIDHILLSKLRPLAFNTPQRIQVQDKHFAYSDSFTSHLPRDSYKNYCDFKFEKILKQEGYKK